MTKKHLRLPHTISYRLSDEEYLKLKQETDGTDLTVHEWCRMVVLDSLNRGFGLTKKERIFYEQAAAIRYLIANGFQLLADDGRTDY